MISHVWSVLCSNVVIDRFSNNVSIQNVIEQLNIPDEPIPDGVVVTPLNLVTLWMRSDLEVPARGHSRIIFQSPSGGASNPVELEVDLTNSKRTRSRLISETLPVEEPGLHIFRVELKIEDEAEWHEVAIVPLEILFRPQDEYQSEHEA